jgi:hypothetical protein
MADNTFTVRIILILVAVVILVVLLVQYNKNKVGVVGEETTYRTRPRMERYVEPPSKTEATPDLYAQQFVPNNSSPTNSGAPIEPAKPQIKINDVKPSESLNNEDYKAVDFAVSQPTSNDCFPRDKNTLEDLLPKDAANTTWAQVNPAGQGDVKDQNFLNAGFHVGMNTVGQTLRNANYQLRSEPPNPKMQVSPWNQSTIEYDTSRRVFEVGEC